MCHFLANIIYASNLGALLHTYKYSQEGHSLLRCFPHPLNKQTRHVQNIKYMKLSRNSEINTNHHDMSKSDVSNIPTLLKNADKQPIILAREREKGERGCESN